MVYFSFCSVCCNFVYFNLVSLDCILTFFYHKQSAMVRYLWRSLIETIAPDAEQPAQKSSKLLSHTIGNQPLDGEGERETNLAWSPKLHWSKVEPQKTP